VAEMEEEFIFQAVSKIIFWSTPLIFLVGLLLILGSSYKNFENELDKEIVKPDIIFPRLERNIYKFREWLLQKHVLVGLFFIVSAVYFFINLKVYTR